MSNMSDQKNASNNGMRHQVWRHRGCSFCELPSHICNQCRAEVNEQGYEREVHIPNVRNDAPKRSIIGASVPPEFIYV